MTVSALLTATHTLAAVIWVGGMFFAYVVLRPSAGALEPPPERLKLWNRVFQRFFAWVWAAVIALPVTGYASVAVDFGGFTNAPVHVWLMAAIGLVMIALFLVLYAAVYSRFRAAVAGEA